MKILILIVCISFCLWVAASEEDFREETIYPLVVDRYDDTLGLSFEAFGQEFDFVLEYDVSSNGPETEKLSFRGNKGRCSFGGTFPLDEESEKRVLYRGMMVCDYQPYFVTPMSADGSAVISYSPSSQLPRGVSNTKDMLDSIMHVEDSGDCTWSTFPGMYVYYDDDLDKELGSGRDAFITSLLTDVNTVYTGSGMKAFNKIGNVRYAGDYPHSTYGDSAAALSYWFQGKFEDDMKSICNNLVDGQVPDMGLLISGFELSNSRCGIPGYGRACDGAWAHTYPYGTSPAMKCMEFYSGIASSTAAVTLCDIGWATENAKHRAQVHYVCHTLGHILGASHIDDDDYVFHRNGIDASKDWIMVSHVLYRTNQNMAEAPMFNTVSVNQMTRSCAWTGSQYSPNFEKYNIAS